MLVEEDLAEPVDGTERGPQIVRHRVAERLKLAVGGLEGRRARDHPLLQLDSQAADLLFSAVARRRVAGEDRGSDDPSCIVSHRTMSNLEVGPGPVLLAREAFVDEPLAGERAVEVPLRLNVIFRGRLVVEEAPAQLDIDAVERLHGAGVLQVEARVPVLSVDCEDGRLRTLDEVLQQSLSLGKMCLRLLAIGDVEHETRNQVVRAGEAGGRDNHWNPGSIRAQVLLLVGRGGSACLRLADRLIADGKPFRRRDRPPVDLAALEIVSRAPDDVEVVVVGLDDRAGLVDEDNTDDVRVDEPPQAGVGDPDLLVGGPLLRDVRDRAVDAVNATVPRLRLAVGADPDLASFGGDEANFEVVRLAFLDRQPESLGDDCPIFRCVELDVPLGAVGVVVARQLVDPVHLVCPGHRLRCDVEGPASDSRKDLGLVQERLAVAEGLLGAKSLGDISKRDDSTRNLSPGGISERLSTHMEPAGHARRVANAHDNAGHRLARCSRNRCGVIRTEGRAAVGPHGLPLWFERRPARQFVHVEAEERPGSRVACHDPPAGVLYDDSIDQVVDDSRVPLLALAQGFIDALAVCDVLEDGREAPR